MKPIVNFFLSIHSYYLFTVGAKSVHGKSLFAHTSLAPSAEIQLNSTIDLTIVKFWSSGP